MVVLGFEEKRKKKRSARSIGVPCITTVHDEVPISSLITKKPKKKNSERKRSSRLKTRTKTRKPKYLSLRLQFSSAEKSQEPADMPSSTDNSTATTTASSGNKNSASNEQLELFPVHPDNLVEEKEVHDENMAYLFSAADGGASTLTGLLESTTHHDASCSSDQHQDGDTKNNDSSGTATTLSPSASLTYAYGGRPEVALVRTALRNKEREPSEERWVRYSEVVERRDDQEVSSCTAAPPDMSRWRRNQNNRLSLKLDYEEILTAWSDKGSLFIYAEEEEAAAAPPQSPQLVPDMHDDLYVSPFPHGMMVSHGWGNILMNEPCCVWRVPEFKEGGSHNLAKVKTEEQQQQEPSGVVVAEAEGEAEEEQWKMMMGQREASVRRYKEKRRNRLFSKRIRYQVRKINAEKRPRLKGRFVKRS